MTEEPEKLNNDDDQQEPSFQQLLSKITHPKQRLFLEILPKFRFPTEAAKAIGSDFSTIWRWEQASETFRNAFNTLKKEIQQNTILIHEKNIDDVCLNADTPAQSKIFGSLVRLRAEAPEKYREKFTPDLKVTGNITVTLGVPPYSDQPARIEVAKKPGLPKGKVLELAEGGEDA